MLESIVNSNWVHRSYEAWKSDIGEFLNIYTCSVKGRFYNSIALLLSEKFRILNSFEWSRGMIHELFLNRIKTERKTLESIKVDQDNNLSIIDEK